MKVKVIASKYENTVKNVAAYARVSSLDEEQLESFDSQREYYENIIKNHDNWNLVGIYSDRGISGTSQARPGFQRLIQDAKAGKIDLILVKSISRFARNAIDTQNVVHELKSINVEVFFEEQNFSSFSRTSEMALNMMASVAESESRSISENTLWALKKKAERGIRHLGNHKVFGYSELDGVLVPNDDKKYVEFIFEAYAAGMGLAEIAKAVTAKGAKPMKGGAAFTTGTIRAILYNEIYVGDRNIQKQPHQDFLTRRLKWGEEYDSVYVEDAHRGIIKRSLWQKVQDRLERKKLEVEQGIHKNSNSHFLAGRVVCGCCWRPYRRMKVGKKGRYSMVWKCRGRLEGDCKNRIVKEDNLFEQINAEFGILGSEAEDESQYRKIRRIVVDAEEIEIEK